MMNNNFKPRRAGFTIVELLVVIVVIGILAAITIVAYTGISSRATVASLQSDLENATKLLKLDQVSNSMYPANLNAANGGKGIPSSSGTNYTYAVSNTTVPQTFCITATKNNTSYNITQDGISLPGICPVLNLDAGNIASYSGTGTTWTDLSGNGNSGTLNGGVTYSNANGGVMSFDGVDDWINLAAQPVIQISPNNFTITGYIKPDNQNGIFLTPMSNGVDQYLRYDPGNQRIYIIITETSDVNNRTIYPPAGSSPLNTWSYFALSINDKDVKFYINGLLVVESVESINIGGWSSWWAIGNRGNGTYWYKGLMGGMRVYNRELSAFEVLQDFNLTKGRYGI